MKVLRSIYFSFPVRLVITHLRFNHFLVLYWVFLFTIVSGHFGSLLGIPYLFLDPVYLDNVNFWSFLIMGLVLAGFTMAFNISSYILDSFRFPFLGTLPKPFAHFCLNNSLIPLAFLIYYIIRIIGFQQTMEGDSGWHIISDILGLLLGYLLTLTPMFAYFMRTNRDIFKVLGIAVDKPKSKTARKKNAFKKLRRLRRNAVRVENYVSLKFKVFSARRFEQVFDRVLILRVFTQNQRNAIFIELFLFIVIISLGLVKSVPQFQLPAAASIVLLLTMIVMFTGAISYWFRTWAITTVIGLFLILNITHIAGFFKAIYQAYGLDYTVERAEYSVGEIRKLNSPDNVEQDKANILGILDKWRAGFGESKPKMVLITASGGGQRSALWTTKVLQSADSVLNGNLMKNTVLMTGASGGLVGAGYYRDRYWSEQNKAVDLDAVGRDVLNPIIFSLFVNDIFVRTGTFEFAGHYYPKDRGYAFEQRLMENLSLEDRKLADYYSAEQNAEIPILVMAPTVVNDGRKLYLSSQSVSFFNTGHDLVDVKQQGVDFRRLLTKQGADSLRFLSALRMSATFPYITPNVTLPTQPPIEIADAGISDNFGVADALTYLHVFKDWILENTSGVILLTIRDSEKEPEITSIEKESLFQRLFSPLKGVYDNWDYVQTIKNEKQYDVLKSTMGDHVNRVEFEYRLNLDGSPKDRASLSWRLTEREKKNIIRAIEHPLNQKSLHSLRTLFVEDY